jgi:hypothetical protein
MPLTKRNGSNKTCRENQNTHFIINNFSTKYGAAYEIVSKNMVEPDRQQKEI